ncbi:MAG: hypothetical protein WCY30_00530 [Candidatus Neomarinimicrobiota bacterium]|jgi:hypothetical protein
MDFLALFKEYGFDLGAIGAIVVLTEAVKSAIAINTRYVPLLPLIFGFLFGVILFITQDLGLLKAYQIFGFVLKNGLIYAGIASFMFKLYKTTVFPK